MTISVLQAQLFFLALTRVMAVIIQVPVLGGQTIPNEYRIGFGALLTIVLVPWQIPASSGAIGQLAVQPASADAAALGLVAMGIAIGRELLLGTLTGFAATLTFGAIQIAGEVMAVGSGFSSSRIFNPALGDSGSAYNQFFVMIAMLYFLVINGHHDVIIALQRTFTAIPVNTAWGFTSADALVRITAQLIAAGIQLALPVLCALLLTDITLGLLARVAPQVQVYFLGLPLKVGVSLVAMSLIFMAILPLLSHLYRQIGEHMLLLLEK